MKSWKSLVVVLIALWLPLQGYGAVAMPFCKHSGSDAGAASAGHDGHHSGHDAAPAHHHGDGIGSQGGPGVADSQGAGLACNDCGACHLACSPLLFSPSPAFTTTGSTVFDPQPLRSPLSFTPEQPQRPPLPALA